MREGGDSYSGDPGHYADYGVCEYGAVLRRVRGGFAAGVKLRLEELQEDKAAMVDFGVEVVTRLCETLLRNGAPGLHFYTINQAEATSRLWKNLELGQYQRARAAVAAAPAPMSTSER